MRLRWLRKVVARFIDAPGDELDLEAYGRSLGVKIGKDCRIATVLWGTEPYLVEIGDHVHLTAGVRFLTHDGSVWVLSEKGQNENYFGKIKVGNNVFIGMNSTILPDVTIGDNVIVGCCSVVTTGIPSNSVAAGVPARVISTLDEYRKRMKGRTMPIIELNSINRDQLIMEWVQACKENREGDEKKL